MLRNRREAPLNLGLSYHSMNQVLLKEYFQIFKEYSFIVPFVSSSVWVCRYQNTLNLSKNTNYTIFGNDFWKPCFALESSIFWKWIVWTRHVNQTEHKCCFLRTVVMKLKALPFCIADQNIHRGNFVVCEIVICIHIQKHKCLYTCISKYENNFKKLKIDAVFGCFTFILILSHV